MSSVWVSMRSLPPPAAWTGTGVCLCAVHLDEGLEGIADQRADVLHHLIRGETAQEGKAGERWQGMG